MREREEGEKRNRSKGNGHRTMERKKETERIEEVRRNNLEVVLLKYLDKQRYPRDSVEKVFHPIYAISDLLQQQQPAAASNIVDIRWPT
ncbi:hypothetical protein M0802_006160 [Mischocyttarus mexicanus]|nr:hypothetical protein M0802_006160 [Mischocyttarus mexicanus]